MVPKKNEKKKIFLINGPAGSGKDTFIEAVSKQCNIVNCSIITGIKNIASTYFKYDEKSKTERDRKFLADLFTLANEYCNYAEKELDMCINSYISNPIKSDAMFICIRNPKYIRYVLDKYGEKLYIRTVCVTRPDIDLVESNAEDRAVFDMDYDIYIENNGNIDQLYTAATRFMYRYIIYGDYDDIRDKTIAICGSMNKYDRMCVLATHLMARNNVVFIPMGNMDDRCPRKVVLSEYYLQAVRAHYLKKIAMADVVIVFKKDDGSIGTHTQNELDFAMSLHKDVRVII